MKKNKTYKLRKEATKKVNLKKNLKKTRALMHTYTRARMHMCTQACTHTRTHVHMHAHARALHTPAVQDETTASASASVIQTTSGRSRGTCTRAALRDGNGQRHSTGWANRHFCNQCLPNFSRGLSQYIFGSYIQVLFLLSDFVTLKKLKTFKKNAPSRTGFTRTGNSMRARTDLPTPCQWQALSLRQEHRPHTGHPLVQEVDQRRLLKWVTPGVRVLRPGPSRPPLPSVPSSASSEWARRGPGRPSASHCCSNARDQSEARRRKAAVARRASSWAQPGRQSPGTVSHMLVPDPGEVEAPNVGKRRQRQKEIRQAQHVKKG